MELALALLVYIECKLYQQLTIVAGLVLIIVNPLLKLFAVVESNCNLISIKYPSFQCINSLEVSVSRLISMFLREEDSPVELIAGW